MALGDGILLFDDLEQSEFNASYQKMAAQMLNNVRTHCAAENSLHWVVDIAFHEDECRVCKDHSAHDFANLRHVALNLLKQDKQLSIRNKRLRAGWDQDFLLSQLRPLLTLQ